MEFLWFSLQLSFTAVIYLHTDKIGTWTKWEVVMLMGASHFIQQVFQAFFLVNCVQLSEQVRSGKLDFFLLLPVNTRFLVSLRQVDLGGFVNASSAIGVIIYSLKQLQIVPSAGQVLGFLTLCVAGIAIHYSIMFMLATVSFWTVRAQGIVYGYYNLFNIARLPDEAFKGGFFKTFFGFVIPMLLVTNVPVRLLAGKLSSPLDLLLLIGMATVWFVLSEAIWRYSVKHYTSASS